MKGSSVVSRMAALIFCVSVLITLQGKVHSLRSDIVVLEAAGHLYHIKRETLSASDKKKVETPNARLSLQIPLDAVREIKAPSDRP